MKGMKKVAEGIYRWNGKTYYERVRLDGKDRYVKLAAGRKPEAIQLRREHLLAYERFREGQGPNPYSASGSPRTAARLEELIDFYIQNGCPDRRRTLKTGRGLELELQNLVRLRSFGDWGPPARISLEVLENYQQFRRANSQRMK